MQHHNYPTPAPEHLAYIEAARRADVPEKNIELELIKRGLTAADVTAALAPGCTVCDIAEHSTEKIRLYSPLRMTLYGLLFGYPIFWWMGWKNSLALRGQDRMLGRLRRFGFLFLAWMIGMTALLGALHDRMILGTWLPTTVFVVSSLCAVIFMRIRVQVYHLPFRLDAQQRDELAPADLMIPFFLGVVSWVCCFFLLPHVVPLLG